MEDFKQAWVRDRAVGFTSSDAGAPLTDVERAALDRILNGATCVAIGEGLHGSKSVLQAAARLLKSLIQQSRSSVLILESCFAATQALDRYIVLDEGDAHDALVELSNWNLCSRELLEFAEWLAAYNRVLSGPFPPVRVFGCDCQSLDGPKSQLKRLLDGFVARGHLTASTAAETAANLDSLPTDRDLGAFVELVLQQPDAEDSNAGRIAEIEAWQNEVIPRARISLAKCTARLFEVRAALPVDDIGDDGFLFDRCGRLLEQVTEFYSPGDAVRKRDAFMAENVLAIQEHVRPERTLLLAHNLHVARTDIIIRNTRFVPMGSYLKNALGDGYRAIGSAVYEGRYFASARDRPEEDVIEDAHIPGPTTFESILSGVAAERRSDGLLVDFTADISPERAVSWPDGIDMRLGEAGPQGSPADSFLRQRPNVQFDGIVFIDRSSPITVLPGYYPRALKQWKSGETSAI